MPHASLIQEKGITDTDAEQRLVKLKESANITNNNEEGVRSIQCNLSKNG